MLSIRSATSRDTAHWHKSNEYFEHEVRQLVVGSHLLLFTIDDDRRTVWIVGLRHGHRLPRQEELPDDPTGGSECGAADFGP